MWKLKPGKTEAAYRAAYQGRCEEKARRIYEVEEEFAAGLAALFHEFHEEIPEAQEGNLE